jgi:D-glycero-D-manno-heptose 1,7-bisphosphate phosphatase
MSQQKAIFLDRDGVINNPGGNYYVYQIENFVINEGIIEFIKEVKNRGYLVIVISNQGGIAKKYYSQDDVERLHEHMRNVFAKENVHVDEIYYCPHHTDIENCLCRKPDSQMLEKAMARYSINAADSFFFGDKDTDKMAGDKAGVNAIQINENENLNNYLHLL